MAGLTKIRIPVRAENCTIDTIKPYLSTIFDIFRSNSRQIRADYDSYCLEHEILGKQRKHNGEANNIVLSPHIRSMVQWKTGYTVGNPIKYAQSKSTQTDDITTLNKYIRNSNKMSIDKQVAEWAYSTGVGYYFIQPKRKDFNVKHEAPFDIFCVEADTCAKVYSSYLGNEPLLDLLYIPIEEIDRYGNKTKREVLGIYLSDFYYELEKDGSEFTITNKQKRGLYRYLPLVEMTYHNMIGISATARSLQHAIDNIASNGVDNIEDIVNEIWVFINTSLGKTLEEKAQNLKAMKSMGAVEINSPNPELKPDIKSIATKLNLNDVMTTRQILLREMYDTNGVPVASSDISSGNVTKGGGEVANGYENAYNRALDDKNAFMPCQRDILERIIYICQKTPKCKLDELQASEIEIKYCFNMSDNILTKTQAYVNLSQVGVPPAIALEKTKLSNDSEAEGVMIEQNIEKMARKTAQTPNNQGSGDVNEQQ